MVDFNILGGTDPSGTTLGLMTQGIGYPLRDVIPSPAGGTVTVKFEQVLQAASFAVQEPTGTNSPIQIEFGAAQTLPDVTLDANGTLTFLTEDEYNIRLRLLFGRLGNPGNAEMFSRTLVNGQPFGGTVHTILDDSDDVIPATFEGVLDVVPNDTLSFEFMRDASGTNAGGLYPATPSLAGWAQSPSALITINRAYTLTT